MSYSAVMVHVDLYQSNDARLQIAGSLAARFDAALIGIAAAEAVPVDYVEGVLLDERAIADRKALDGRMADAEWRFRSVAERHANKVDWRCASARPTEFVAQQARAADLLVAGAVQPDAASDPSRSLDPGALVLQAGRPVFIIPPDVTWLRMKHMLVAWKDSREARRAILDALPLLRCAQDVDVVAIPEGDDVTPADLRKQVDDVVAWLGRHDVVGFGMVPEPNGSAADQLAFLASETGADIVIAGAYGHARMAQQIFGGVTQSILTRANHCTLFAH
jgi:nucleotide-binding universal stress UspA family protein